MDLYEVHNYRNAAEILANSYPEHWAELLEAFRTFRLSHSDIVEGGKNESRIPKRFSELLRPHGWEETRIAGDLVVRKYARLGKGTPVTETRFTRTGYLDGHRIDYVKDGVAFDLEWNSKDQTFDRDLFAFRTFFECGVINVGVLVTRSESLNALFRELAIAAKYGASTTWMGKLLFRLDAGRSGGCPVLALGITPKLVMPGALDNLSNETLDLTPDA